MLGSNDRWEFFKDKDGQWKWRRIALNGNIVGTSAVGYVNESDCIDDAKRNGFIG